MSDKSWKRAERKVAEKLNGKRNPLSGRMGGHTRGDVIHDMLYVEVKQRRRFEVLTVMRDTEDKASKERKIPVVVLHQKGTKKRYYLIEEWLFLALAPHLFRPPVTTNHKGENDELTATHQRRCHRLPLPMLIAQNTPATHS